MNNKLTLKSVRTQLTLYNVTITKKDGEYKVRIKNSPKGHGYFTNDLKDALDTGIDMVCRETERIPINPIGGVIRSLFGVR